MHSSEPQSERIAELLVFLHQRGMVVRPNDAMALMRLFEHSQGWPHHRRVEALKLLLARTDEERDLMDELAPVLFTAAPRPLPPTSDGPSAQVIHRAPQVPPSKPGGPGPTQRTGGARRASLRRAAVALAGVVIIGVTVRETVDCEGGSSEYPVLDESPQTEPSDSVREGAASNAAPDFDKAQDALRTPATPDEMTVEPEQPGPPRGPDKEGPIALEVLSAPEPRMHWSYWTLMIGLIYLVWLLDRQRGVRRQRRSLKALASSVGPRRYTLAPPKELASSPQDPRTVRDFAFRMSAPVGGGPGDELDMERSLRQTAENAGLPTLLFRHSVSQPAVLIIEDVGRFMVRWPGFVGQVVRSMQRQGAEVHHYFMVDVPTHLSTSARMSDRTPLAQVLQRHSDAHLFLAGTAEALDEEPDYPDPAWLGEVDHATWLHPQPKAFWSRGAQRLARRMRLVAMDEDGMRASEERSRRSSPEAESVVLPMMTFAEARDYHSFYRASLSLDGLRWLAAGALLASRNVLTAELWWALRAEGILRAPRLEIEQILASPQIRWLPSGAATMAPAFGDHWITWARREQPELVKSVVEKVAELVAKDADALERMHGITGSVAAVQARATQASLLSLDQDHEREAVQLLHGLNDAGFGEWTHTRRRRDESSAVRRARLRGAVQPVGRMQWCLGVMLAGAASIPFVASLSPLAARLLDPVSPAFRVAGEAAVTPRKSLKLYDAYQLQDEVLIRIGSDERRLHALRWPGVSGKYWEVPWSSVAKHLDMKKERGEIDVALSYPGRLRGDEHSWKVRWDRVIPIALRSRVDPFTGIEQLTVTEKLAEGRPRTWVVECIQEKSELVDEIDDAEPLALKLLGEHPASFKCEVSGRLGSMVLRGSVEAEPRMKLELNVECDRRNASRVTVSWHFEDLTSGLESSMYNVVRLFPPYLTVNTETRTKEQYLHDVIPAGAAGVAYRVHALAADGSVIAVSNQQAVHCRRNPVAVFQGSGAQPSGASAEAAKPGAGAAGAVSVTPAGTTAASPASSAPPEVIEIGEEKDRVELPPDARTALQNALDLFSNKEYPAARDVLVTIVGRTPSVKDPKLLNDARELLAASLVLTGDEQGAEQQFRLFLTPASSCTFESLDVSVVCQRVKDELAADRGRRDFENILARLKSADPGERVKALDEMVVRGDRVRDEALVVLKGTLYDDDDDAVRAAAARAMGRLKMSKGVPHLISALRDMKPDVRRAAAGALRLLPDREAISLLLERLQDVDAGVREQSLLALGAMGGPTDTWEIAERLADTEPSVRIAAARCLGEVRDAKSRERLVQYALDSRGRGGEENDAAITAIASLDAPANIEGLSTVLNSTDLDQMRVLAIKALGKVGDKSTVEKVRPFLSAPEPDVAKAANEAVAKLLEKAPQH